MNAEYFGTHPAHHKPSLFIPNYRPVSNSTDPFLSSPHTLAPLRPFSPSIPPAPPHSPSSNSFSQSRKNGNRGKGRPVSMFISPSASFGHEGSLRTHTNHSSGRYSPSKRASVLNIRTPSPAPFVGVSGSFAWGAPAGIPPSPLGTPHSPSYHPSSPGPPPSIDVEMANSFATPPSLRVLPSITTLSLIPPDSVGPSRIVCQSNERTSPQSIDQIVTTAISTPLTPTSSQTSNRSSSPNPHKSSIHLSISAGPLTPPLTPPLSVLRSLPPVPLIQLVPSPAIFTTLSARLLANHTLHPLFDKEYSIQEELGSGGFGFVVSALRSRNGVETRVAVKFIYKNKVPSHGWVNSRHWGDARGLIQREDGARIVPMEAYVLRNIRHDGVVGYLDSYEDAQYFYLVMEHHGSPWQLPNRDNVVNPSILNSSVTSPSDLPALAAAVISQSSSQVPAKVQAQQSLSLKPMKPTPMARRSSCDLFECVEEHGRFSEEIARSVLSQIVEVVYALGKLGIVHRDLKDENIVIDANYKVKLIDFGSAVIFDPRRPAPFYNRFHGTTSFASAEILRGEPYQAQPSEIWSLGVLLSILITGECPFIDASAAAVGRLSKPKIRIPPMIHDLLLRCLDLDVERRITIEQVRQHPWLQGALERRV